MPEYIEREALLRKVKTYFSFDFSILDAVLAIERAPAADVVEVRHGRWKYNSNAGTYHCPNCGVAVHNRYDVFDMEANDEADLNFCPNCGVHMDGDRYE